jgi:N-acyl-L-homoserine lactone synthetase
MKHGIAYSAIFCREPEQPEVVDWLMRFRKELFVDRCGWDLTVRDGRERDEFDTESCIHCALFENGQLVGGFRAISTDKPCLATKVFPHLATLQPVPQRRDYWEISRFGVVSTGHGTRLSLLNYGLMFYFAQRIQARALVAVADLAYERFLETLGIRTRRYGPPQQIGCDKAANPLHAVVGEIPIAAQAGERFEKLIGAIRKVEIKDASKVFGPTRISA